MQNEENNARLYTVQSTVFRSDHTEIEDCTLISASEAERVCSRELLSTVIWEIKTTWYLRNYWFFSVMVIKQKMLLFVHIIDIRIEPARPGPTRPGTDALWRVISQLIRKIQMQKFNTMWLQVLNDKVKFWTSKNLYE